MPRHEDLPREVVLTWARSQLEPRVRPDDFIGYCTGCGEPRRRRDVRQEERDETCVHVCSTCGAVVNEGPPF